MKSFAIASSVTYSEIRQNFSNHVGNGNPVITFVYDALNFKYSLYCTHAVPIFS